VEEKSMVGRMSFSVSKAFIVFVILSFITPLTHAQRDSSEAKSWLRWSQKRREAYVVGYVEGYYRGYSLGCQEGTRDWPGPLQPGFDNFPVNKCLDQKLDLTKGIDLTKDVTTFYRRYPENRDLLIKEILEELGKGRSLEEIHNHPPFTAMDLSTRHDRTN
jgi:hypothetical protein